MITMTPKHWLFFFCLIASVALVFLALRVVILDHERREFAVFVLTLSACGAGWGTWAHVHTHERITRVEKALAEQRAVQREALTLRSASKGKGNLSSVD
ncbi:hypothetical protein [Lentzea sp. NPDC059081]|uniref:hypothetical protein n=1 Tax=Lentzea sp. NPDC059081 TaxID=3346719 RepID=UPI0036B68A89